jgi:hypothetical protein
MPQLQKAIPVAAAPFKKFLRVVIGSLPNGRSLGAPACFQLFFRHIAKAEGIEQSYRPRITAGRPET